MSNDITLHSSILVVDDSLFILKAIREMLQDRYDVRTAESVEKAREMLRESIPDLILLDLEMPKTDGYQLLEEMKGTPEWQDIPAVFLTGMNDRKKEEKALSMGAMDYILKPISEGVLKKRIQIHLELKIYQKNLENLIELRTKQLFKTQDAILDILANVTTYRDNDTGEHIIRTTNYSRLIAEKLWEARLPGYEVDAVLAHNIGTTAKLHDIGKIGIADQILLKKGGLTPSEFETIKRHTIIGSQMIDNAINDLGDNAGFLVTAREIILHHHEWWDGRGYPHELKGEEIPLPARIMAIADVYDALISDRPYKKALPHEEAINIMKREAGTHFDPVLMEAIDDILPEFMGVAYAFRDGVFYDNKATL